MEEERQSDFASRLQGRHRRERLQQDEEGGEVVHLWILQKTKGERPARTLPGRHHVATSRSVFYPTQLLSLLVLPRRG